MVEEQVMVVQKLVYVSIHEERSVYFWDINDIVYN